MKNLIQNWRKKILYYVAKYNRLADCPPHKFVELMRGDPAMRPAWIDRIPQKDLKDIHYYMSRLDEEGQ